MNEIKKILEWVEKKKKVYKENIQNGKGGYDILVLLDDLQIFILTETKGECLRKIVEK